MHCIAGDACSAFMALCAKEISLPREVHLKRLFRAFEEMPPQDVTVHSSALLRLTYTCLTAVEATCALLDRRDALEEGNGTVPTFSPDTAARHQVPGSSESLRRGARKGMDKAHGGLGSEEAKQMEKVRGDERFARNLHATTGVS